MGVPTLAQLALAGVISLIAFLGYGSQYLFCYTQPGALDHGQSLVFNLLLFCAWLCYASACFTDPGHVPREWFNDASLDRDSDFAAASLHDRVRWCRKCENRKPPRAHHCKVCQRCIPKMDHHCPWTINCVSHRTFPHFFRFLFYAVTAMCYLEYLLYIRLAILFRNRSLPSYLGPTPMQMIFLFTFTITNSITLFALTVLLIRSIYTLGSNTTTIEGWEIDRHDTLVRRARSHGGYLDGPDGRRIRIQRQEFPYDIGIYQNMKQGMGGVHLWAWLWPFATTPPNDTGLDFETNGFEDPHTSWPPPDPDRIPRRQYNLADHHPFTHQDMTSNIDTQAFRERQQRDYLRFSSNNGDLELKHRVSATRLSDTLSDESDNEGDGFDADDLDLKAGNKWRDQDGDRPDDFGVDEEVEYFDEDDLPLSEILKRQRAVRKAQ